MSLPTKSSILSISEFLSIDDTHSTRIYSYNIVETMQTASNAKQLLHLFLYEFMPSASA